jgi:hypothetical protein
MRKAGPPRRRARPRRAEARAAPRRRPPGRRLVWPQELAALLGKIPDLELLRDRLRAGDIWVVGSRAV